MARTDGVEAVIRLGRIETPLTDADFVAEWFHRTVRSHGICTIIPPHRTRPTDKPPSGRWR